MSPIEFYTKEEKKTNGVFYTPTYLAEYLAKRVIKYFGSDRKITTVIDPACGDSMLLRSFANVLLNAGNKSAPKIFGVDKDINAIISSTSKFSEKSYKKLAANLIHTDGLFPFAGKTSLEGWDKLKNDYKTNGFDIALSNPPWGADLNGYDPMTLGLNFSLARGQFDIFDLFVEVILGSLKQDGIYGLILPDSVFSQEQAGFRCLLSKNTTIYLIARLGEKIFPEINRACVIIVGRKAKAESNHQVDCFRLSSDFKKRIISNELTLEEVENDLSHKVPQSRFFANEYCGFDIDLKTDEKEVFDKIQSNSTKVKNYVKNTRGAEISKKGIVCQCPKCLTWMPLPKSKTPKCNNCKVALNLETVQKEKIIVNHNGTGNLKLKVGEDLYRYTSLSKSWINTQKNGINYKDLNIYTGEKILVRKTGVGITASMDYENSVTNQVVYILSLKPVHKKILSLEFVLAVLNSRIMTYYLIKKYGENEWKSHPYLTQTMLVNLPFPNIDYSSNENKKIINRVTKIIRDEVTESKEKNISRSNDLIIEKAIARLFNLDRSDYEKIFETIRSSEQLIPIRRLLNLNVNDIFQKDGI